MNDTTRAAEPLTNPTIEALERGLKLIDAPKRWLQRTDIQLLDGGREAMCSRHAANEAAGVDADLRGRVMAALCAAAVELDPHVVERPPAYGTACEDHIVVIAFNDAHDHSMVVAMWEIAIVNEQCALRLERQLAGAAT